MAKMWHRCCFISLTCRWQVFWTQHSSIFQPSAFRIHLTWLSMQLPPTHQKSHPKTQSVCLQEQTLIVPKRHFLSSSEMKITTQIYNFLIDKGEVNIYPQELLQRLYGITYSVATVRFARTSHLLICVLQAILSAHQIRQPLLCKIKTCALSCRLEVILEWLNL